MYDSGFMQDFDKQTQGVSRTKINIFSKDFKLINLGVNFISSEKVQINVKN